MLDRITQQEELELESLAASLLDKYPDGYLADDIEVGWPCRLALRDPVDGLDSPRCILAGSYQELRAFEIVYNRLRRADKSTALLDVYAYETLPGEVEYWQAKGQIPAEA